MGRPKQRANGSGTVFRVPGRKRPWCAQVTVGWSLEGRPLRKARYASSRAEAKLMLADMLAAMETSRPLPDDRLTVGRWLTTWFRRLQERDDIRPNTVEVYERSVRLLLPELGNVPLRRLRSTQVETALNSLRRYSNHTAAGARAVLSTAIKDAMRAGHVTTNEAALARAPRTNRQGLPAPSTATVRQILTALEGHRLRPLYVLLAGTGLRIGEATGLRWEDIDDGRENLPSLAAGDARDGGRRVSANGEGAASVQGRVYDHGAGAEAAPASLTVRYQLQRIDHELVLTDPKTDTAGRVVYLPATVAAELRQHRVRQAEERLRAGRKWRDTGLVFTTTLGQPLAQSAVEFVLSEACKRAGTGHWSPHAFRRYVATTITDAIGRDAAQRVLGHTSGVQTERYVSRTDVVLQRAADALQEALA